MRNLAFSLLRLAAAKKITIVFEYLLKCTLGKFDRTVLEGTLQWSPSGHLHHVMILRIFYLLAPLFKIYIYWHKCPSDRYLTNNQTKNLGKIELLWS